MVCPFLVLCSKIVRNNYKVELGIIYHSGVLVGRDWKDILIMFSGSPQPTVPIVGIYSILYFHLRSLSVLQNQKQMQSTKLFFLPLAFLIDFSIPITYAYLFDLKIKNLRVLHPKRFGKQLRFFFFFFLVWNVNNYNRLPERISFVTYNLTIQTLICKYQTILTLLFFRRQKYRKYHECLEEKALSFAYISHPVWYFQHLLCHLESIIILQFKRYVRRCLEEVPQVKDLLHLLD